MFGKLVVSLALIAHIWSSVYGMEVSEQARGFIDECRKQNNLEMDQIRESIKNKKLPETEAGKCFMECVLEKLGVVEDGKLNAQKAKLINAMKLKDKPDILEKANQVVDKCSTEAQNSGEKCAFGLEISKCAMKYAKEFGIPEPQITV